MHSIHSKETIRKAALAWTFLIEAFIQNWVSKCVPRVKVLSSIWKYRFENIRMQANEDPQPYMSTIDEAVEMLVCLEVYRDKEQKIDAITRGPTKRYETESRALPANPVSSTNMLSESLGSDVKN